MHFDHLVLGQRVLFGSHQAAENLGQAVTEQQAERIMLIAGGSQLETARKITAQLPIVIEHTDVVMHVPIEIAEHGRQTATDHNVDLIVCVGGGSTTGLAKAVALTTGIPIIAIPTTYSGSEATNVWGLTEDARKVTGTDDIVLPKAVIYDAALTLQLPMDLSVASGLNGLAHCIDSLWAPTADPINAALAVEGIRALHAGLPQIIADPTAIEGRDTVFYGGYLAAVAFASAGSGLHHKICHVLGGTFDLPHAQTHATVLPYVLAFNQSAAPVAARRIADAMGSDDALAGLNKLYSRLKAPTALADYGFTAADIPVAVDLVLANAPAKNPRDVTAEHLTELLTAALYGHDPAVLLT